MATVPNIDPVIQDRAHATAAGDTLLVCLPSMASDAAAATLRAVASAFRGRPLLVASPDTAEEQAATEQTPHLVPYPTPRGDSEWVLDAADYVAASDLARERGAAHVLLLGPDASALHPTALVAMQNSLQAGADIAMPHYRTATDDGLVNSALLYPLTRALYADIRFPLPLDLGLSTRMLQRLAGAANRVTPQPEASLIWPVAEASVAGFTVRQVEGGERLLPQPTESDLNVLFPAVTGSLFADLENKASFWQRARALPPARPVMRGNSAASPYGVSDELHMLVENYRAAFNNLREIWSLVLPPQSLLALKKLATSSPENFSFAPALWARTVYDFALAFHMRTLNRGHLLGAFTPLYLAWVASFLRTSESGETAGADLLELTAHAFEQEKPYLVSRWRWPDRFNP